MKQETGKKALEITAARIEAKAKEYELFGERLKTYAAAKQAAAAGIASIDVTYTKEGESGREYLMVTDPEIINLFTDILTKAIEEAEPRIMELVIPGAPLIKL